MHSCHVLLSGVKSKVGTKRKIGDVDEKEDETSCSSSKKAEEDSKVKVMGWGEL